MQGGKRTTERARTEICQRHGALDSARRQTDPETGELVARDLRESEAMMSKPQTFQGDLANLPPALRPLTEQNRWVVWRWELRPNTKGKPTWTKPPYRAFHPRLHARCNDPNTWSNHGAAVAAVMRGEADGIGLSLMDSGLGAIDLDNCVNGDFCRCSPG
jgi:hypothetical protein